LENDSRPSRTIEREFEHMIPKKMEGSILAARHSFMPNRLGYCGPDENDVLFDACLNNRATDKLLNALKGFQAAYPYLRFIAQSQGFENPFDYRAVEAYWIGNDVLQNIAPNEFYDHLRERFEKKFPKEHVKKLFETKPFAAFPHHALHVFNAFSSMSSAPEALINPPAVPDEKVARLMDQCRISWGKVLGSENGTLRVEYEPVQRSDGKLVLGTPVKADVMAEVQGRSFVDGVKRGDWVSFHWGFACTVLTPVQVANLRKYTLTDMALANLVPIPQ
jgi:hypothetical protein